MAAKDHSRLRVQEGRDDMPIFIHSELDDYGLSLVEFRVYARLARRCGRAAASESVPNMARDFGVNDRTVQRALRLLVSARLIAEERRPGKTTLYTLLPRPAWAPASALEALRTEILGRAQRGRAVVTPEPGVSGDTRAGGQMPGGDMRDGGVVTPERGVVVTPEPDEGSPSEGTPSKVLPLTHTREISGLRERDGASGRVCVPDGVTMYSTEQWREYVLAHPVSVKLPEQFVWSKRVRGGELDEAMREWYAKGKPVEGSSATAKPADTSACPDCGGRGHYFTTPTDPKTYQRCTHPRLAEGLEELQREYDDAKAELAGASRS